MKKRILSLLCVLALCLGLLPTAALAAGEDAPAKLYVGNQNVKSGEDTTYWTTNSSGELTQSNENGTWNVKYAPGTSTLTLNSATITGSSDSSVSKGAGIYALCSSEKPVSLTIELIGTNTITGYYGIYVEAQQGETVGTNASLLIQTSGDDGSLAVSGSFYGIYVKSGTGDASLTIKDASVVASSSSSYYDNAGVCVQSGSDATSSPQLSLAVNGGSLTTSASEGNDGIQFYVGSPSDTTNATTSLTISDNAIVRAENGIKASRVDKPTPSGTGIVFDGTEGTVYGDVTLDESLTIDQGETLTVPEGSALNTNGNLTNNGTIVDAGGTLTGELGGTIVTAPAIITESLPEGMAGQTYTEKLEATGNNITWSLDSGALPAGLTLNSDGTITGTPSAEGSSTFTVKAENSAGVTTKQYTLNIKPATVPVTGVILDQTELSLFTGESKTLTATVQPDTATDKTVTWESSDADIVTVTQDPQDGAKATVTAKAAGEATITVKTADGGYTDTCTVKVTQSTYGITSDTAELGFGSAYTDYDRPAAQTVTITNTGNRPLTLTQPASTNSFEVGTLSKTELAPDEKATFTVQPKADLAVGSYQEPIKVTGSNGSNAASADVSASFTVVNIHDSSVKTSLTITPDVSAGIPGTAFTTAEKVKSELTRVLVQDASYTAGNTAFYDVKMQYSLDGGQTWLEATEATFPTEGITVTLPYPSGTGKDTHNFRVVHMFTVTSNRLGTTAGNTETPAVTKTDSGLQVTLRGLSPVVIGWDKIETQSSTSSAASAPADDTTYYTCPACGYHNWTATQAGYRCDNCGYLESVKQLSGYGNVKGTYTPGSGAAATAASTVPQTGDESNPVLWTVLLLVSGLALGGLAIAKRKKQ